MALPTLLLTRPRTSAEAFAATLDKVALARVRVEMAPLMQIDGLGVVPDLTDVAGVIFTSANGVDHAPVGAGRLAFCVGERTTQRASDCGWKARKCGDTAQDLIAELCNNPPASPLIHLCGAHTRGQIARHLTDAGIATREVTLYEQTLLPLGVDGVSALMSACIVPVFSPRSAQQLVDQARDRLHNAHIIALSDSVAAPFAKEHIASLCVLSVPQGRYMRKAVENLCLTVTLP